MTNNEIVVWGIPSCGTVKKARVFLDELGVQYRFADLRATPPTRAQVERWVSAFGTQAMKNTSGGSYRALPADKDAWSDAQWIAAFVSDPMLIKRPVIERADAPVVVGFRVDELRELVK